MKRRCEPVQIAPRSKNWSDAELAAADALAHLFFKEEKEKIQDMHGHWVEIGYVRQVRGDDKPEKWTDRIPQKPTEGHIAKILGSKPNDGGLASTITKKTQEMSI